MVKERKAVVREVAWGSRLVCFQEEYRCVGPVLTDWWWEWTRGGMDVGGGTWGVIGAKVGGALTVVRLQSVGM